MEEEVVEKHPTNERFLQENSDVKVSPRTQYGIPDSYNPHEYPPVTMRINHNNADKSETQRKRRSKNRLSNRRSTGFITSEEVDEAMRLGVSSGSENSDENRLEKVPQ